MIRVSGHYEYGQKRTEYPDGTRFYAYKSEGGIKDETRVSTQPQKTPEFLANESFICAIKGTLVLEWTENKPQITNNLDWSYLG